MVIANIPDVHPLADRRTNSRTVKTDGNASEITKRGIIFPSGGLDGWKNTRSMLKLSGAWLCGLSSVPQGSVLSRVPMTAVSTNDGSQYQ